MKKFVGISALVLTIGLGVQSSAEAVPIATLYVCQQGFGCSGMLADTDPDSNEASAGTTLFGDYRISSLDGTATEGSFVSNAAQNNTTVTRVGGSNANPLEVFLFASSFNAPVGTQYSLGSSIGATASQGGPNTSPAAAIGFQAFFSASNFSGPPIVGAGGVITGVPAGTNSNGSLGCTPPTPVAPNTTSCSDSNGSATFAGGVPFSLITRTTFNIAVGDTNQYGTTGRASVIAQTPIPEPGSMLLLGTGLLGLARAARRRYAKS